MTDPRDPAHPLRVTIYGSCVSRDAVSFAGHDRIEVAEYVARQSLLSAGHDSSAQFPAEADVSSAFQLRMMRQDFAGDLAQRLRAVAAESDLLLWDLTDERHGVHVLPDGTVVTRSIDAVAVPEVRDVLETGIHVRFGEDEHFEGWKEEATRFHGVLESTGLLERTVVLRVPWASRTLDGGEAPSSWGITPEEGNARYGRYYDHLSELGFRMITLPADEVRADPEHRWGLAPFHYSQDVYETIIDRVLEAAAQS